MLKELNTLNCEEEAIHLCGKIQNFGYLIVFNSYGQCIAISENCKDWVSFDFSTYLKHDISYFLDYFEIDLKFEEIKKSEKDSFTFQTKIADKCYQLHIYLWNNQFFLEFEKNESLVIDLTQFNEFQSRFENSENIWQSLCDSVAQIIDYDRVMIYQFLEDNSGIVIAEQKKIKEESILGYRYPEFDIPLQARNLYLRNLSRQVPDINQDTVNIVGTAATEIDLSKSQIRALSPVHLEYLKNFGVQASASFSIIIENKLWGLVACQNILPKYIPYNKRNISLFITHYAANKYLVQQQRIKIAQDLKIKEIELQLKEKLLYTQSYEKAIAEFAPQFMQTLTATGLIIKSPDYTLSFGDTPNNYLLEDIHTEINERMVNENIFTSHEFNLLSKVKIDNNYWTGIARLSLDDKHEFSIYLFRKEILIEEKWAGIPEKKQIFSQEKNAYIYSPRTSFQLWKKEVKGQSEKWSKFDIVFLKRIQKLIQDSMLRKMNEVKKLNEKLIEANNKLDTYTHQLAHDLKNPLSTIKTSGQFMYSRSEIPKDLLKKFAHNIVDAANLINDIIDRTIESSKTSLNILKFEPIATEMFINQLIQQALQNYKVHHSEIKLGELHPVFGEKTLLYQLFMNLINNAVKFSSKKPITIIEIYSTTNGKVTTYFIKDNGIGINEMEKEKVFSMHKRLSNANEFEGTGIGMAIVKRIVTRLNAEISFESTVNDGTIFKITFPNE